MKAAQIWSVYLLLCRDGSLYCGISTNPQRRLSQHNGKIAGGAKYTRCRRPVFLVGSLECGDKSAALKLERAIKSLSHRAKLAYFARGDNARL